MLQGHLQIGLTCLQLVTDSFGIEWFIQSEGPVAIALTMVSRCKMWIYFLQRHPDKICIGNCRTVSCA